MVVPIEAGYVPVLFNAFSKVVEERILIYIIRAAYRAGELARLDDRLALFLYGLYTRFWSALSANLGPRTSFGGQIVVIRLGTHPCCGIETGQLPGLMILSKRKIEYNIPTHALLASVLGSVPKVFATILAVGARLRDAWISREGIKGIICNGT